MGRESQKERRAEVRRVAIRRALKERNLTLQKACELAGLPNANALGNFLSGRSRSLNLETLEPLAQALKLPTSELIGEIPSDKRIIVVGKTDRVTIDPSKD